MAAMKTGVIALFDVDGTLTAPRKAVTLKMLQFMKELGKVVKIGVVGGSDLVKISKQLGQTGKQFVPPMMDPVLGDYARNFPDARESEVLSLFATIINKYKGAMIEDVPHIFEASFQCTLEVFKKFGVEKYDPINEQFDPHRHNAVFQVPDPTKDFAGDCEPVVMIAKGQSTCLCCTRSLICCTRSN